VCRVDDATPFDIERYLCVLRESGRKGSGKGTLQIVIIKDARGEPERSLTGSKVHVHTLMRNKYGPKDTIRRDVGIVVVNLIGPNGAIVQIQSNETQIRI
jgi:hypothetical protein